MIEDMKSNKKYLDPQPFEGGVFLFLGTFMTARFVLILGGARSGKSSFAMGLAEKGKGKKIYLATAEALDDEMRERIEKHKKERPPSWKTVEEPEHIPKALRELRTECNVVVLDCITLWLSNLLHSGYDEKKVWEKIKEFQSVVKENDTMLLAVSNEVGLGIVPDNPLARRFRDLAGKVNQKLAEAADEVYFLVSGIPQKIKSSKEIG